MVHWPLMGGLLHLVQRGGLSGAAARPESSCAKCNSAPINGQCTNHRGPLLCGFNVPIKRLTIDMCHKIICCENLISTLMTKHVK